MLIHSKVSEIIILKVAQKNILGHDNRIDCPQGLADGHLRSDGEMKSSLKATWRTSLDCVLREHTSLD